MENVEAEIKRKFLALYAKEPMLVRSPGRINLIGEHTDYNDGFVMPAAIDKDIIFAIAPSNNGKSSAYALKYDEKFEIDLQSPQKVSEPKWANFFTWSFASVC